MKSRLVFACGLVIAAFGLCGCTAVAAEDGEKASEQTNEEEGERKDEGTDESAATETDEGSSVDDFGELVVEDSPFAEHYDLEAFARQLQGVWVAHHKSKYPSSRKVWKFDGERLETWEDGEHREMTYKVVSPCMVNFTIKQDGATQVMNRRIVLGESKNFARTQVGIETDRGGVACLAGEQYELTESGCTVHEYSSIEDEWSSEEADCKIEGDTFVVADEKLEKVGNVFAEKTDPAYELGRFESLKKAKKLLEE